MSRISVELPAFVFYWRVVSALFVVLAACWAIVGSLRLDQLRARSPAAVALIVVIAMFFGVRARDDVVDDGIYDPAAAGVDHLLAEVHAAGLPGDPVLVRGIGRTRTDWRMRCSTIWTAATSRSRRRRLGARQLARRLRHVARQVPGIDPARVRRLVELNQHADRGTCRGFVISCPRSQAPPSGRRWGTETRIPGHVLQDPVARVVDQGCARPRRAGVPDCS